MLAVLFEQDRQEIPPSQPEREARAPRKILRRNIDPEGDEEYPPAMSEKREILFPLRRGSRSPEEFEAAVRKVSAYYIARGREDFRKTDPLATSSPRDEAGSTDDKDLD